MSLPSSRLVRSRSDKMIAGVAGGIAQYLAIDPVIVRVAFVALCFTGIGMFLYPVLWFIMPLEGTTMASAGQTFGEMQQQAQRVGEGIREVFVQTGAPRYDPLTGQPIEESEIPINNLDSDNEAKPEVVPSQRYRLLGFILLGVGGFILLTMIPGVGALVGRFMFPAILIVLGIWILRRPA